MNHTGIALVIGGGIAGPAAAMALQKAGIDSVVYEAHPTGAEGIGVFLTLASNGVDALRVLGADGPALAATFAVRQQNTPRRLHGQVMTTAVGVKIGMLALGAGAGGVLAGSLDPAAVVLVAAAIQLVAVCVGWVVLRAREPVAVLP